jgi:hypothetical protein
MGKRCSAVLKNSQVKSRAEYRGGSCGMAMNQASALAFGLP